MANLAAGIVISKLGTVPIKGEELLDELESNFNGQKNKIFSLNELLPKITDLTAKGKTIGFTNGCFDMFHAGHACLLQSIKEDLPDDYELVVGVNGDESVKKNKGPDRPIISQEQ